MAISKFGKVPKRRSFKPKVLFKDKAGNTLSARFIKTRKSIQLVVKNRRGGIVDEEDTRKFINLAKRKSAKTKTFLKGLR